MRPTRIPGADPLPLGAPPDWKPDENGHCAALFIRRERIEGVDYMRSAWEVDPGEAGLLYAGARLVLGISGQQHPVVHLTLGDLPSDFEPFVHARRFNDSSGRNMVRVEMIFAHAGGRKAATSIHVDGTLADAVSIGITECEALARREGWIE